MKESRAPGTKTTTLTSPSSGRTRSAARTSGLGLSAEDVIDSATVRARARWLGAAAREATAREATSTFARDIARAVADIVRDGVTCAMMWMVGYPRRARESLAAREGRMGGHAICSGVNARYSSSSCDSCDKIYGTKLCAHSKSVGF